jgi:hypothetical protein
MPRSFFDMFSDEALENHLKDKKNKQRQNKMILNRILKMCLDKDLIFLVNPSLSVISVHNAKFSFNYCSYYEGSLMDYEESDTKKLENLFELVKKYNKNQ